MDPYIERREIWPDFHDRMVTHIAEALQPQLRPRYVALMQDRLYVVEHRRPIRPDVSLVRVAFGETGGAATMAAGADQPLVVEIVEEEISQPVVHIIEPAADNRLITAIQVLSPDNKAPGAGQESYVQKREELWQADAHLVEVDLLRVGKRLWRVDPDESQDTSKWQYVVVVSRRPRYCEFYPVTLRDRLPRVGTPLAADDSDVTLDLQAVFSRCWQPGPYPALLHYNQPPPGNMSEQDAAWCREKLTAWASPGPLL
jgi:hypothetical protein